MDTQSLYHGLTFLAWTSVIFLIVVGGFIVKVLFDLSKLMKLINQTASLVRSSAEPILTDVTETVGIVNKMVKRTENNVDKFKNLSSQASKLVHSMISKTSVLSGAVAKGLWEIIKSSIKK